MCRYRNESLMCFQWKWAREWKSQKYVRESLKQVKKKKKNFKKIIRKYLWRKRIIYAKNSGLERITAHSHTHETTGHSLTTHTLAHSHHGRLCQRQWRHRGGGGGGDHHNDNDDQEDLAVAQNPLHQGGWTIRSRGVLRGMAVKLTNARRIESSPRRWRFSESDSSSHKVLYFSREAVLGCRKIIKIQ